MNISTISVFIILFSLSSGKGSNNTLNIFQSYSEQSQSKTNLAEICSRHSRYRIGCCKPHNVTVLYDAMLSNGNFVLYKFNVKNAEKFVNGTTLPPITVSYFSKRLQFNMSVITSSFSASRSTCTKYFDGTLHVFDRATLHNLFHICNNMFIVIINYNFFFFATI